MVAFLACIDSPLFKPRNPNDRIGGCVEPSECILSKERSPLYLPPPRTVISYLLSHHSSLAIFPVLRVYVSLSWFFTIAG